jgi:ribose 5-phosphate isomerase B
MISESEVRQLVAQTVGRLAGNPPAALPPTPQILPQSSARKTRFVYQDEVRQLAHGAELRIQSATQLTPLARELVLERKIKVVVTPARSATSATTERLVAIGSDHGGFALKEALKAHLAELGFSVRDVGTTSTDSVDYPDFAYAVARLVASGDAWRGIMVDGAGIGSCMVANKVPGVRASLCYDVSSASNAREHNDANVLTLGGQLIGPNLAKQIVKTWLTTDFGGGRHARRIEKIVAVEKRYAKS